MSGRLGTAGAATGRRTPRLLAMGLAVPVLAGSSACGQSGEGPSVVPTEPLVVNNGQFISGPMPGALPSAPDAGATGPAITIVSEPILPIVAGSGGRSLSGYATQDAVAVGVEIAGLGTGYWLAPTGNPDPNFPGQITFGLNASFNPNDPPGLYTLRFVAVDAAGRVGQQFDAVPPICLDSLVPDNQHVCFPNDTSPRHFPPDAVISLRWDTDFDLDLHVLTPEGIDLNPQHPAPPLPPDAGAHGPPPPCAPRIDRDSLGSCVPDGVREEDLVFPSYDTTASPPAACPPPAGAYRITVDPFAPCGQLAAHFVVTVYTLAGSCPSCSLQAVYSQGGELLASQVSGGTQTGLYVHDQTF